MQAQNRLTALRLTLERDEKLREVARVMRDEWIEEEQEVIRRLYNPVLQALNEGFPPARASKLYQVTIIAKDGTKWVRTMDNPPETMGEQPDGTFVEEIRPI